MMSDITVQGNDAISAGTIEIVYNRNASISPLHLDFIR